jgi:hypothetical protein
MASLGGATKGAFGATHASRIVAALHAACAAFLHPLCFQLQLLPGALLSLVDAAGAGCSFAAMLRSWPAGVGCALAVWLCALTAHWLLEQRSRRS